MSVQGAWLPSSSEPSDCDYWPPVGGSSYSLKAESFHDVACAVIGRVLIG